MLKMTCGCLNVGIDEASGETTSIVCTEDEYPINYVLSCQGFGTVDGFIQTATEKISSGIVVHFTNAKEHLSLTVRKSVEDGCYTELYTITNEGERDYFLSKDNFGIRFPFSCHYKKGSDILQNNTISHIWCGKNTAWIKSQRLDGKGKKLWMTLAEGSVTDYSIIYPANMPFLNYRGIFLLHSENTVIPPKKEYRLAFKFAFDACDEPPCDIVFSADKYTVYKNERICFNIYSKTAIETVSFNRDISYEVKDNTVKGMLSFDEYGEKTVEVTINGKCTFIRINVIPSIFDIMTKRADFIIQNQQYHNTNSSLDGAYLIYDRKEKCLFYSSSFPDSNACRERLSMGIVVACALQKKYNEEWYKSLVKHRAFVEREIFDKETFTVYNEIGKSNDRERLYNYPWLSTYYFEWYNFNHERQCLLNSAGILLRYYEVLGGSKQESVCMETYRIISALKEAGENEAYERLYRAFLDHADAIVRRAGETNSEEVSWANGMVSAMTQYLSQAYLLSGNMHYLDTAKKMFEYGKVFYANQPDYHLNSIAVRFWDGYWFGKTKCYGDTMPQWLSSLSGLMCYWYQKASETDLTNVIENNLKGAMCLYKEDGYAASCYLYPYAVFSEFGNIYQPNEYIPGRVYGKQYDDWANDQDWSLYYAHLLLK